MATDHARLKIAIVGPCAAGKSTLTAALQAVGYVNARNVGQEHSYVPDMWQRLSQPDVLIYLDVSDQVARQRRHSMWEPGWLEKEHIRLRHARQHCDLYLQTDAMIADEVAKRVLMFLSSL